MSEVLINASIRHGKKRSCFVRKSVELRMDSKSQRAKYRGG